MMKIAILFVVGVIAKQTYGDAPEAIVGGKVAAEAQFPYQASLQVNGQHICGGTIIDPTHIVTAAHCVDDNIGNRFLEIVTGTIWWQRGEKHKVKCIRLHAGYTGRMEDAWKDDIAVITVTHPIRFNRFQSPIPLATQDYTTGTYRGITSGWGKTSVNSNASPVLKWLGVNVLSKAQCLSVHNDPQTNTRHVCIFEKAGHGICSGDSGGPLVVNGQLCGVTSWSAPCALGVPDVFTNVYHYLKFIRECQAMC